MGQALGLAVLLLDGAEAVEGALCAVEATVRVGERGDLQVGALGVATAVVGKAVEHGARGKHPAPLRMLGRIAGTLVVQRYLRPERPLNLLQQVGAVVAVEI